MKAVIFYELGPVSLDQIQAVYPRHKATVDTFAARGEILAIGTFADFHDGAMAVFKDKDAAEKFVKQDPFVLEGIVGKATIKEWNETLLK